MTHLVVVLCIACASDKKEPTEAEIESPLGDLLSKVKTPLSASSALRTADFKNCNDLLAVLHSLDARNESAPFASRATMGIIEESLEKAGVACPKKYQKKILVEHKKSPAAALAFSLIESDLQVALDHLSAASDSAAILQRRAQLFFKLEQHRAGRDALAASLRFESDPKTRVRVARMLTLDGEPEAALTLCEGQEDEGFGVPRAGAFAALGKYKESIQQIDQAPLHLRQEIAEEAARFALDPVQFASEKLASAEVLVALRTRMGEQLADGGAELLQRAALLKPEDGDLWIALATLLESTARPMEAVGAWDQAAKFTPGAERPILAPIRLLREEGRSKEALLRARALADAAKGSDAAAAEGMRMASLAFHYAGDAKRALEYARRAVTSRPGDGRLLFELSSRLEAAGKAEEAARVLSDLLVCGARGQVWHRHEVAARLSKLVGADALDEHISKSEITCAVVDAEDLKQQLGATF
jgi:tetratricopeptide (TPR) repeat protein